MPKTTFLVALQAHIFSSRNRRILLRLLMTSVIGAVAAAVLFFPLVMAIPFVAIAGRWVLLVGGLLGFLKGDLNVSLIAVKIATPIDRAWQFFGSGVLTLATKFGCLFLVFFFPLVLLLYLLNVPQALLRMALKVFFGDIAELGDLYRDCLFRPYLF